MTLHDPDRPLDADLRAEAYVDGELSPDAAARFEADLAREPALRAALAGARRVRDDLHRLPQPACPPELTAAVLAEARRRDAASWAGRLRDRLAALLRPAVWRPALAVAVLCLVALAGTLTSRTGGSGAPTDPAVAQALHDVRWALAVVADAGETTGRSVRDDVLAGDVLHTVRQALGLRTDDSDRDDE